MMKKQIPIISTIDKLNAFYINFHNTNYPMDIK